MNDARSIEDYKRAIRRLLEEAERDCMSADDGDTPPPSADISAEAVADLARPLIEDWIAKNLDRVARDVVTDALGRMAKKPD